MVKSSTPVFTEFDPSLIPWQDRVVDDVYCQYDYSKGVYELLLSGSVGSAKSTLLAHLVIRHCLENYGAKVLICRKDLPSLKQTLFAKIIEHIDEESFKLGVDYTVNETRAKIKFLKTGSEIIAGYWKDKRYKRFRSYELSMAVVEELTENNDEDKQAYDEITMRVGRLPHIKQNLIICATNPDGASHWAYKHFILQQSEQRRVYYSLTRDNPFLPKTYIEQLEKNMDPKLARRMLNGEWIDLNEDKIYYAYNQNKHYKAEKYSPHPHFPIYLCFDFNIADGKPMSSAAYQYIGDHFHIFDETIVHGSRTLDIMEEWKEKGIFNGYAKIIIHGDATGQARDTRSIMSDYDLIKKFLSQTNVQFEMQVPRENPPIRSRHNRVNAYFQNAVGESRVTIYNCPKVDEGFRLTALKKGGQYIEDDSKDYQHVTTAIGYGIYYDTNAIAGQISSQKKR